MTFVGIAAAIAAAIAFSLGIALQALDAREAPPEEGLRLSLLARLARRRRWVAGLLLGLLGFGLQVVALAFAAFVVVQPLLAAGLLLLLYLGVRLLGERVGKTEIAGAIGITVGIALLTWGSPTEAEGVASPAAVIAVTATLSLAALTPFALRGRARRDSAMLVVVASALAFGAANIATKVVSVAASDAHWLAVGIWLAVAGAIAVVAILTEMTALQRRPATIVVPVSFAVQTFLPVVLAPIYLSEHWDTAALGGVPLVAGLAIMLFGALALARSPAVGRLAVAT